MAELLERGGGLGELPLGLERGGGGEALLRACRRARTPRGERDDGSDDERGAHDAELTTRRGFARFVDERGDRRMVAAGLGDEADR